MSSRAKRKKRWEGQTIEFAASPLDIQAAGDTAPSFTMRAYNGGLLHLANFAHPAVVDVKGVSVHGNADTLPILRDHDGKRPVGHGQPQIGAESLDVTGTISQTTDDAKQIVQAAQNGYPWQASIGGRIAAQPRLVKAGRSVNVNGKKHAGPVYVVGSFVWTETSVVSIGADSERATTSIAASRSQGGKMSEFDKWLEAKGFDASELSQTQEDALRAAYNAESAPDPESAAAEELESLKAANVASDMRAELASVASQVRKVNKLAERYGNRVQESILEPLHASALNGDISPTEFELELVKAARPQALPSTGAAYTGASADAIVAAMCQTAGMSEEQTGEALSSEIGAGAADKAMNDAIGLKNFNTHKLIYATLAAHGQSIPAGTVMDDSLLRAALECSSRTNALQAAAGFSTISLPGILSRVANKAMLSAYTDAMGVGLRFASQTSTTDFKQFDRYRLTESGLFEEVGATGEIKSSTMTEELLQNQVKQYGRMFAISRVMLINDDLGAMLQVPRLLGRMASHTLEQTIITTLVNASTGAANSNFFYSNSSAKKKPNYATGAETALDIDSLSTAYELFLNQVDSDGKPVMIEPSLLLVTTANAVQAGKLYNDGSYRFTGSDIKETIDNQWRGRFSPLISPYLGTLGSTPSTTQWYLLPAPTDTAVINVAFLRGQSTPTIQQSEVDFNQLGVQMRGVFDFGVALWDQRLGVKMSGTS